MKLAIVRHGQTYYNATGLVQGRSDIPLNDLGIEQARTIGRTLASSHAHFDIIMSSTLTRAYETASEIAKALNYTQEIMTDARFIERDFHHLDGTSVETAMPLVRSKGYAFESYETDEQLIKRISSAALDLEKKYPDQSILLVAHSHVIKALLIYAEPHTYTFADLIKHVDIIYFEIHNQKVTVIK